VEMQGWRGRRETEGNSKLGSSVLSPSDLSQSFVDGQCLKSIFRLPINEVLLYQVVGFVFSFVFFSLTNSVNCSWRKKMHLCSDILSHPGFLMFLTNVFRRSALCRESQYLIRYLTVCHMRS
jgi:hypothetical protein